MDRIKEVKKIEDPNLARAQVAGLLIQTHRRGYLIKNRFEVISNFSVNYNKFNVF